MPHCEPLRPQSDKRVYSRSGASPSSTLSTRQITGVHELLTPMIPDFVNILYNSPFKVRDFYFLFVLSKSAKLTD